MTNKPRALSKHQNPHFFFLILIPQNSETNTHLSYPFHTTTLTAALKRRRLTSQFSQTRSRTFAIVAFCKKRLRNLVKLFHLLLNLVVHSAVESCVPAPLPGICDSACSATLPLQDSGRVNFTTELRCQISLQWSWAVMCHPEG
ncbi:hypothetical protein VNO78_21493 [Psophocarpus tetragonolobus]|uniref:Uncharacterized protein n=1 Tax=Psophocarpus tetragonolobus TaxID=3891 RepID=A0AAN9SGP0_PSOTE